MRHRPDCVLDPVYWLRHAAAAAGHLVSKDTPEDEQDDYDRISAMALLDQLAILAELPSWRSTTLLDLAEQATLMGKTVSRPTAPAVAPRARP